MILFALKGVDQSTTESMTLVGYTAELVHYEPDGMPLGDLVVFATDPITAGSLEVTLYRNGLQIAQVALSTTLGEYGRDASTARYLNPGDRLNATVEASADMLPDAINDVVAIVLKG